MSQRKYTDEEVLAALREADAKVDGPITQGQFNDIGSVCYATVTRYFGGWNKAKKKAGLDYTKKGHYQHKRPGLPHERKRQKIIQVTDKVACSECGENLPGCATDFHHVRGEKIQDVSQMASYSWDRIKDEMKKCEILCANCHRIKEHSC